MDKAIQKIYIYIKYSILIEIYDACMLNHRPSRKHGRKHVQQKKLLASWFLKGRLISLSLLSSEAHANLYVAFR